MSLYHELPRTQPLSPRSQICSGPFLRRTFSIDIPFFTAQTFCSPGIQATDAAALSPALNVAQAQVDETAIPARKK
jgi:hypothetical protein